MSSKTQAFKSESQKDWGDSEAPLRRAPELRASGRRLRARSQVLRVRSLLANLAAQDVASRALELHLRLSQEADERKPALSSPEARRNAPAIYRVWTIKEESRAHAAKARVLSAQSIHLREKSRETRQRAEAKARRACGLDLVLPELLDKPT